MKNHPTDHDLFLNRLSPFLSDIEMERIDDAYVFSKYAHRPQKRMEGERYFEHPRAVALIIMDELLIRDDWKIVAAALLHDTLEDSWLLTPKLMKKIFGRDVASWVSLLTRIQTPTKESFGFYARRVLLCGIWQVLLIKVCDRIHNLRSVKSFDRERKERYIKETELFIYPLAEELIRIFPHPLEQKAEYLFEELVRLTNKTKEGLFL